jgi:hypothetical protein
MELRAHCGEFLSRLPWKKNQYAGDAMSPALWSAVAGRPHPMQKETPTTMPTKTLSERPSPVHLDRTQPVPRFSVVPHSDQPTILSYRFVHRLLFHDVHEYYTVILNAANADTLEHSRAEWPTPTYRFYRGNDRLKFLVFLFDKRMLSLTRVCSLLRRLPHFNQFKCPDLERHIVRDGKDIFHLNGDDIDEILIEAIVSQLETACPFIQ